MRTKLELPADLPLAVGRNHKRLTFKAFSSLILQQKIETIEATLSIKSPDRLFRHWLVKVLWRFYCNSGTHVWNSRSVLKRELRKSSGLAARLKSSAHLLWQSHEPAVLESLSGLVEWQSWQSLRPMHPSGIVWIALLDEFATRTGNLARSLSAGTGGPRHALALENLLQALGDYYRAWGHHYERPIQPAQFVAFAEGVFALLRQVRPNLPEGSKLRLPPGREALRKRLLRLSKRISARQKKSNGPRGKLR